MNTEAITPIMKKRLEFLKENQHWEYQKMKDNGTLIQHLKETEQEYLDNWQNLEDSLKSDYNRTHETKLHELPWAEMASLNEQFISRAREIAESEVLFKRIDSSNN